jgi:hypothetical protein
MDLSLSFMALALLKLSATVPPTPLPFYCAVEGQSFLKAPLNSTQICDYFAQTLSAQNRTQIRSVNNADLKNLHRWAKIAVRIKNKTTMSAVLTVQENGKTTKFKEHTVSSSDRILSASSIKMLAQTIASQVRFK